MKAEDLKMVVKEKYSEIATQIRHRISHHAAAVAAVAVIQVILSSVMITPHCRDITRMLIWDWVVVFRRNLQK